MAKSKADPTGQSQTWKKGSKVLQSRLDIAHSRISKLFRTIPKTRSQKVKLRNADNVTAIYDYDIEAIQLQALSNEIEFILNEELLESQQNPPPGWYWAEYIEQPYRAGTGEEVVQFNQMVAAALIAGAITMDMTPAPFEPAQVFTSRTYRQKLAKQVQAAAVDIKKLSQETSAQVMQQIGFGIDAGDSPSVISKAIQERFDVSKSSADRIARTEVQKAFTDGKMDFADAAAEKTGLRSGVLHISALTTTTRSWHADRHGNAYTTAAQREWCSKNANRINCLCLVRSVLIDAKGNVIDAEFQEEIKAEKVFFE